MGRDRAGPEASVAAQRGRWDCLDGPGESNGRNVSAGATLLLSLCLVTAWQVLGGLLRSLAAVAPGAVGAL
jgi:hypothetical protein